MMVLGRKKLHQPRYMGFSAQYSLENNFFALIRLIWYVRFLEKIILSPGSRADIEL